MRPLSPHFTPYGWALSTREIAARAGIAPERGAPLRRQHAARSAAGGERRRRSPSALERINAVPRTAASRSSCRDRRLQRRRARRTSCSARARTTCSCSARARTPVPATGSRSRTSRRIRVYRVATWVAGAEVGDDDPVLTFVCRPHNPTGALVDLPSARPLVVDEAYFEYAGETAVPLLDDDVIVVAHVLEGVRPRLGARRLRPRRRGDRGRAERAAGARAGLDALRGPRARRRSRQGRPTSRRRSPSASGSPTACARSGSSRCRPGRTSSSCRTSARPSSPTACSRRGLPVRPSPGAIRITVHRPEADDRLLEALAALI